ncbi:hypothetical protein Sfulv_00380 [Streptomyces fulvorobeus]|uniref:Uncharacterized protein n=1 Tax=Streptomyces fulvorobeus TaxID=284028 RepID=A0A7J0BZQ2_9ACTN|nr:hypothetical protein Sfulv_00380 [Streptomyces fulvorobeus]
MLIRRSLTDGERAYYLTHTPAGTRLAERKGRRRPLRHRGVLPVREERSRLGSLPGPANPAWYRHITLAMAAAAHLTAIARRHRGKGGAGRDLIRLSVNEIRRLLSRFAHTVRHEAGHILHWSHWRRRHQYRARLSHYRTPRPPTPITAAPLLPEVSSNL